PPVPIGSRISSGTVNGPPVFPSAATAGAGTSSVSSRNPTTVSAGGDAVWAGAEGSSPPADIGDSAGPPPAARALILACPPTATRTVASDSSPPAPARSAATSVGTTSASAWDNPCSSASITVRAGGTDGRPPESRGDGTTGWTGGGSRLISLAPSSTA